MSVITHQKKKYDEFIENYEILKQSLDRFKKNYKKIMNTLEETKTTDMKHVDAETIVYNLRMINDKMYNINDTMENLQYHIDKNQIDKLEKEQKRIYEYEYSDTVMMIALPIIMEIMSNLQ